MDFIIVGLGGFIGAMSRYSIYLVERASGISSFPVATLFVNILGSFLAGILLAFIERNSIDQHLILFGAMGFAGSFTTFSTFGVESFALIQSGKIGVMLLSIILNLVLGIVAIWFGRRCGLYF